MQALCESAANVVANDINGETLSALVSSLEPTRGSILIIASSAANGGEIIKQTIEKFGAVHAIINATLGLIPWSPFAQTTDDGFRNAFETNFLGPISLIRAAWPHFVSQNFGRVVNFTSDSMLGFPTASTYTFSKGALLGVNKTLAMEGRPHNILVNCVSPIAFVPHMERHISNFSPDVQEAFRTKYQPEANVPMILALVDEGCKVRSEVFTTSGYAVGRCRLGYVEVVREMRSVDECLEKVDGPMEKAKREVYEPSSTEDFTEWQVKYVLGK